jgi:hypothetical protein
MDFGEALTNRLPAPRDDEPAGLRQDIVDELADHLTLSVQRERMRGHGTEAARARALERFGDPAAVACRLWTDAMKGKIMAQRVLIGTCVLVAAASVSSVAILWRELVHARRIAAEGAAAQVAEARVREQEMLRQLREMSQSMSRLSPPNGSDVRIKLVDESADGRPVEGASIGIICVSEEPPKRINRTSDSSGSALFGSLPTGEYRLLVKRRWADGYMSVMHDLEVRAGTDVSKVIVCPKVPPERAALRLRWRWPADLEAEPLTINASFRFCGVASASGLVWSIDRKAVIPRWKSQDEENSRDTRWSALSHSILCGPSNKVARFSFTRGLLLWKISSKNSDWMPLELFGEPVKLDHHVRAQVLPEEIQDFDNAPAAMSVEVGSYELVELVVLRPVGSPDAQVARHHFGLLAAVRAPGYNRHVIVGAKPPTSDEQRNEWSYMVEARKYQGPMPGHLSIPTIELPREFWVGAKNHFEAKPGQANEWTIPLPNELIEAVRTALKAVEADPDNPAVKAGATKESG